MANRRTATFVGLNSRARDLSARACALSISLAALCQPGAAQAQGAPSDAAKKAQPLFDEATTEMDRGDYESACVKLLNVTRLVPEGIGAKETLAECYEKQGRTASAYKQYVAAAEAAQKQKKTDRERKASAQAAELLPRVSKLSLTITELPADVVVRVDGAEIATVELKTPILVDAGKVHIEVEAPGRKTFSTTLEIPADGSTTKLTVPVLAIAESRVGAPSEPLPSTARVSPPSLENPPSKVDLRFVSGFIASGVGAVTLGLGIVSTLQVNDAQGGINKGRDKLLPGENVCTLIITDPQRFGADAPSIANACGKAVFEPLQFVFYGIAAASVGVGIYLFATSGKVSKTALTTFLAPTIGPRGGGVTMSGSF